MKIVDNIVAMARADTKFAKVIESKIFDNFAPSTSNAGNIATVPKLHLSRWKNKLKNFPIKDLQEVIIIKDDKYKK